MRALRAIATGVLVVGAAAAAARADETAMRVGLDDALRAARRASPDLAVARARERVAHAEVRAAGQYPNPSVAVGTNTQAARLSGTLTLPLAVFGQIGAAIDAAKADEATSAVDSEVAWNDVRQATVRAYVGLWLAEGVSAARRESAAIAGALEAAVNQRVEVGSAPELDALRVHAEKLRADAEVLQADAEVTAAGGELGLWIGIADGTQLRAAGVPPVPDPPPSLASLADRVDASASVRRERSDERAARARVARERALVRPGMSVDLGADFFDPTFPPGAINYRAQLLVDVPLFNQRGGDIDRAAAQGDVAQARASAARLQATAGLRTAFVTFQAASGREKTLVESVVPAAQSAAKATEEAYTLGRAQLVAVLDAERALIDARVTAIEARAARAVAWADVEHAIGTP
jgi:outer membrane protein, heavy metal efflux system